MYNAVKKFLALYHHLTLSGIGNFSVETAPSNIDFTNRSITSSHNKIVFSNDNLPAEKRFYKFISQELNIDEMQAEQGFADFTAQLQNNLNTENNIYLKDIGTLTKQSPDVIIFQSEDMPEYFPALTAERIIRKNVTHTVRVGEDEKTSDEMHTALHQPKKIKKERWWIAATILAVIGVAAIIFYYATHG
jgi:nucleoid DNA-binding protein